MPQIASTLNEFHEYVSQLEKTATPGNFPIVCLNFKSTMQNGQTCKLVAGHSVQQHLFFQQKNSSPPLPLYKNHHQHDNSLRQRAKEVLGSEVGEVYGPTQINYVLSHNQFEAKSYRVSEYYLCQEFIKEMLTHNTPVITYFDVAIRIDVRNPVGEPINQQGQLEHSAVIIGCYTDSQRQMRLLIAQWGKYFEFSFDALYQSTSQLTNAKQPEVYKKYQPVPPFFDHPMWLEVNQMDNMLKLNYQHSKDLTWQLLRGALPVWPSIGERHTIPPKGIAGSMRNIFTVITGDQQSTQHLSKFDKYLAVKPAEKNTSALRM